MSTTGTFQNTLTATVSGTAISTSFTGFARYSFSTHVNPLWTATTNSPAIQCIGCHTGSPGTSNLSLSGTAAANYSQLVNVNPFCDASLAASGWRRVNSSGGNTGNDFSVILRMVDSGLAGVGLCNDGGAHATKMSAANLAILRAWIRNGAPNN